MLLQQNTGSLFLIVQDAADFFVDDARGFVRVLATRSHQVLAEEDLLLTRECHRTHLVAHAPFANHATRDVGRLLEVVGRTAVEVTEHDHLGDTSAHRLANDVLEVFT